MDKPTILEWVHEVYDETGKRWEERQRGYVVATPRTDTVICVGEMVGRIRIGLERGMVQVVHTDGVRSIGQWLLCIGGGL